MSARRVLVAAALAALVAASSVGCSDGRGAATGQSAGQQPAATTPGATVTTPEATVPGRPFVVSVLTDFDEPWAMTFLPDGSALVTQRGGALLLVDPSGAKKSVAGTPKVVAAGQGGLGDVVLAPSFGSDRRIYLSWVEAGEGGASGAVVGRATLTTGASPRLEDLRVLWRQEPKVIGQGHFAHRMAVSPDGRHLFVTSGDRQKFDPAQDLTGNLGKVLRLSLDGDAVAGNPFTERGGAAGQTWSYGHRNPLGIAFDAVGNLWVSEMGPRGGDEVNLVLPGRNYGWPAVSNGSHYSGEDIPDHRPGDGFEAPKVSWNPSVSPGSLMAYSGERFPAWRGDLFIGALSGKAIIRVDLDGADATLAETWDMGARIREVEQGPDGSIWLLEDEAGGRLLRLTPP